MSWQAVHRVIVGGPDHDKLWRLLVVVADFADERGNGASVGSRLLAERCRVSKRTVLRLLAEALEDEWLVIHRRGGPRRQAVYNLGPRFLLRRELRASAARGDAQNGPDTARNDAQHAPRTVHRTGLGDRPPHQAGGPGPPTTDLGAGGGTRPEPADNTPPGEPPAPEDPAAAARAKTEAENARQWARDYRDRHRRTPTTEPSEPAPVIPLTPQEPHARRRHPRRPLD